MNKYGQAAMEFLTTYGWAFLVILLLIGLLSYLGVLDVNNFVPYDNETHVCELYTVEYNPTEDRYLNKECSEWRTKTKCEKTPTLEDCECLESVTQYISFNGTFYVNETLWIKHFGALNVTDVQIEECLNTKVCVPIENKYTAEINTTCVRAKEYDVE